MLRQSFASSNVKACLVVSQRCRASHFSAIKVLAQYYGGIVRNVEQTEDADLPEALSHLSDVEAVNGQQFFARLQRCTCLLLHLSEGTDEAAQSHFIALHLPDNTWAITPALAGIHSLALEPEDFQTMRAHGGAMIWSPLSNLLLYGKTADVKMAKQNGVRIGIGSDWSPSGSNNLLGELKVAHLYSAANRNLFTERELLSMATRTAAEILQWEKVVGSIETILSRDYQPCFDVCHRSN